MVLVALGQMGSSAKSARTEREVVTAGDGVVQKTVAGTGDVEPVTDEDVDFQTGGTLAHVDVKQGEYVHRGELLATLDDATDALTVKQARATLTQARATLASDRKTLADAADSSSDTSADVTGSDDGTVEVADDLDATTSTTATTPTGSGATTTTTGATTTPSGATTTSGATAPTTSTTAGTRTTSGAASTGSGSTGSTDSGSTSTGSTNSGSTSGSTSSGSSTGSSSSGSTSSSGTVTAATIDSDTLAVDGDEATVKEDEDDLAETRLTAPVSGTITSLESIEPGATVSSGTDSSGSDSSTDGSSSGTTGTTSDANSTSSDTSSSAFAEIDSLRHLSMTVSFTESDISELEVGQPATIALDALSGVELAGKVTAVSSVGTTSDDVVSYDATITLDQYDARVKPGMSASATVIIKQGHGVTVPSSAVTGTGTLATVTEQVNGRDRTEKVIVGTRGTDEDLIVSGLKAGDKLVETETLPAIGSSASTSKATGSGAGAATGATGGRAAAGFGAGAGGFGAGAAGGGPP